MRNHQSGKSHFVALTFLYSLALSSCSSSAEDENKYQKFGISYSEDRSCPDAENNSELELSEGYAAKCLIWQSDGLFEDKGEGQRKAEFIWEKLAPESQEARLGLAMIAIQMTDPGDPYFQSSSVVDKSADADVPLKTITNAASNENTRKLASFLLGEFYGFNPWFDTESLVEKLTGSVQDGFKTSCILKREKAESDQRQLVYLARQLGIEPTLENGGLEPEPTFKKRCPDVLSSEQQADALRMFGAKRNVAAARKWFAIADDLGHPCAKARLADLNAYSMATKSIPNDFRPSRSDIEKYATAAKSGCQSAFFRLAAAYNQAGPNQDMLKSWVAYKLANNDILSKRIEESFSFQLSTFTMIPTSKDAASDDELTKSEYEKGPKIVDSCKSDMSECELFSSNRL